MARYNNIKILKDPNIKQGARHYKNVWYPEIPFSDKDIFVITTQGDRLDVLANKYYGNISLYWIISIANNFLPQNSLFLPVGTQLRIPSDISEVISKYNNLNS
jgi:phage tail protein X